VLGWVVGRAESLHGALLAAYPELAEARWRRGGLPPRIGGWCLGVSTVAAITLGRTVWLAPSTPLHPELLLHELRHVAHFAGGWSFPLRYAWGSLRWGYHRNPYEVDARRYAAARLDAGSSGQPQQGQRR
jgi:hypothetical protein